LNVIPSEVREFGVQVEGSCLEMREHIYYVYILASAARVLYTGVTSNLHKRTWQHKEKMFEGFTDKFRSCRLVYWESFDDVRKAIDRGEAD
jgi:putative endonuclease